MNIHHIRADRANYVNEARAALEAGDNAKFDSVSKEIGRLDETLAREERMQAFDAAASQHVARDSVGGQVGNYSLRSALENAAVVAGGGRADGLEAEISQELARNAPSTRGMRVPLDLILATGIEQRDQTTTSAAAALSSKFGPLINRLKPQSKVIGLGATVVQSEGYAPLEFPRHLTGSAAQFVAEGSSVTASDPTWNQLVLAPTQISAQTVMSRQFLKTNSINADQIIQADLNYAVSNLLDSAALNGTGVAPIPTGIWTEVAATTASAAISDTASDLISAIELADNGTGAFLLTSKLAGVLRKIKDTTGRAIGISEILHGYNFADTNQVPAASRITYGVWSDLIIALWGSADIIVNPYKFSSTGAVEVTAWLSAQVGTKHGAKSFSWADVSGS
ncbi:phage major capsid protein [Agrobacterium rhizogenes]|nr:phage major capsid protein [Rhizobium rhizogenes]NTI93876.1 phage major capsid protein [Rhizobium rhizogenes]NTJ56343.1 phage major capsid protein [Rhizobium rhizogenes]OCJ31265.1 hypothetical protein A6U89_02395 [Agrobacterium sp. B133/95]